MNKPIIDLFYNIQRQSIADVYDPFFHENNCPFDNVMDILQNTIRRGVRSWHDQSLT